MYLDYGDTVETMDGDIFINDNQVFLQHDSPMLTPQECMYQNRIELNRIEFLFLNTNILQMEC